VPTVEDVEERAEAKVSYAFACWCAVTRVKASYAFAYWCMVTRVKHSQNGVLRLLTWPGRVGGVRRLDDDEDDDTIGSRAVEDND
jgi:hypothetical protein